MSFLDKFLNVMRLNPDDDDDFYNEDYDYDDEEEEEPAPKKKDARPAFKISTNTLKFGIKSFQWGQTIALLLVK